MRRLYRSPLSVRDNGYDGVRIFYPPLFVKRTSQHVAAFYTYRVTVTYFLLGLDNGITGRSDTEWIEEMWIASGRDYRRNGTREP